MGDHANREVPSGYMPHLGAKDSSPRCADCGFLHDPGAPCLIPRAIPTGVSGEDRAAWDTVKKAKKGARRLGARKREQSRTKRDHRGRYR